MVESPDVLRVDRLSKHFGSREAVRELSFSVGRGEILGLLGPNGAGKTTTIGVIAGSESPSSGSVTASGELGLVPQHYALYPSLTARENLQFFGRIHGLSADECRGRAPALLELAGIVERAGERVERFSGGMKRRLSLACGIIHEPAIVLLDEPTVGVDPQSRERIYEALAELSGRGIALLLTTHAMEEAERLCDRVVILDEGIAIASGSVPDVVRASGLEQSMEIALARPPGLSLDEELGALGAARTGDASYALAGLGTTAELTRLLELVSREQNDVAELQLHRPNLGDVFLHLTGKALRD